MTHHGKEGLARISNQNAAGPNVDRRTQWHGLKSEHDNDRSALRSTLPQQRGRPSARRVPHEAETLQTFTPTCVPVRARPIPTLGKQQVALLCLLVPVAAPLGPWQEWAASCDEVGPVAHHAVAEGAF